MPCKRDARGARERRSRAFSEVERRLARNIHCPKNQKTLTKPAERKSCRSVSSSDGWMDSPNSRTGIHRLPVPSLGWAGRRRQARRGFEG